MLQCVLLDVTHPILGRSGYCTLPSDPYISGSRLPGGMNCHKQDYWSVAPCYSDNYACTLSAWTENLGSYCIADVMSHGHCKVSWCLHGRLADDQRTTEFKQIRYSETLLWQTHILGRSHNTIFIQKCLASTQKAPKQINWFNSSILFQQSFQAMTEKVWSPPKLKSKYFRVP
jgi:hypothetical protein